MADISKINVNGTEYDIVDTEAHALLDKLDEELINNANIDLYSYGVEWDITVADPACTRIGNPSMHRDLPVQSLYKGCVVKNGILLYYLNPNDWAFKEDGTPSVLDGTDGDVYVHTPKFYYRSFINGNKRQVRFSMIKIDDTWIEMPEAYVGAYKTALDRETLTARTVVNTDTRYRGGDNDTKLDAYLESDSFRTLLGKPATQISRANMRKYVRKNGTELLCYEYYKVIFYWAYVIEYANFNCQLPFNQELTSDGYHQGGLGAGVTNLNWKNWTKYNNGNPITPCGYTNNLGNFTGIKPLIVPEFTYIEDDTEETVAAATTNVIRWRGFDNPFGDIWTNLEGIVLKGDIANGGSNVYTTTNPLYFDDTIDNKNIACIETAQTGYIKTFDLRDTAEIIPSVCTGADQNTYKCDNHWTSTNTNTRTIILGGTVTASANAGLCFFSGSSVAGIAYRDVGFRTIITLP